MPFSVEPTEIPDVLLVTPPVFADDRGCFLETWHGRRYAEAGIDALFVQDNLSRSRRGVLRGLHFQLRRPQAKLLCALRGEIWDVAVDLRRGSPTFGRSISVILSEENRRQLYIPEGFAHGFCVLSETADVHYKCSAFYDPQDDCGVRWNDPRLGIDWPVKDPLLSPKDSALPLLEELADRLPKG